MLSNSKSPRDSWCIIQKNSLMNNPFAQFSNIRSWFSVRKISLFWYRFYRRVFLIFFTCILIFGAWYWYYSLYQYSWTERDQKTFLDSYAQETDFKDVIFKKVVATARERQNQYEKGISLERDYFRLDKLPEETK